MITNDTIYQELVYQGIIIHICLIIAVCCIIGLIITGVVVTRQNSLHRTKLKDMAKIIQLIYTNLNIEQPSQITTPVKTNGNRSKSSNHIHLPPNGQLPLNQ